MTGLSDLEDLFRVVACLTIKVAQYGGGDIFILRSS